MDDWFETENKNYNREKDKIVEWSTKISNKYNLKTCLLGYFNKKEYTIILTDGIEQLPPFEFTCDDLLIAIKKWNASNSVFSHENRSRKQSYDISAGSPEIRQLNRNLSYQTPGTQGNQNFSNAHMLPNSRISAPAHNISMSSQSKSSETHPTNSANLADSQTPVFLTQSLNPSHNVSLFTLSINNSPLYNGSHASSNNIFQKNSGETIQLASQTQKLKLLKHEDIFLVIDDIEDIGLCYIDLCRSYSQIKIYVGMYQFFRVKNATDLMLDCLKTIPLVNHGIEILMQYIMSHAKLLTSADRCSVWLKEGDKLRAIIFDGQPETKNNNQQSYGKTLNLNAGTSSIAGRTAKTGCIYVTKSPDLKSDEYFNNKFDKSTGYITKSILCFPIKAANQKIVAVGQLINKRKGSCFSKFDEHLATRFVGLCGSTIQHVSI